MLEIPKAEASLLRLAVLRLILVLGLFGAGELGLIFGLLAVELLLLRPGSGGVGRLLSLCVGDRLLILFDRRTN